MPPAGVLGSRNLSTSEQLSSQWRNPNDILSLLLLVGGDVLQQAIAQQAGNRFPTPVVFSFGWVGYAFTSLLSAVGNNRLMPLAPGPSSIILSTNHGHTRTNDSWILNRILKDYENFWMPKQVKTELEAMLHEAKSPKAGLCIAIFEASRHHVAGVPRKDWYWVSGYVVALIQLGIAAVPCGTDGSWQILLLTAGGTALAFVTGSLPQWREERWSCRRNSKKTFALTHGNGAQHVIIIKGAGRGLDLEDISSSIKKTTYHWTTKLTFGLLTALWGVLLITISGVASDTWYLLAIGALGMIHTVIIAAAPRLPDWFGIYLEFQEVVVARKVMAALQSAEKRSPGVGRSLLPIFFPGTLREEDAIWWSQNSLEQIYSHADIGSSFGGPFRRDTAGSALSTIYAPPREGTFEMGRSSDRGHNFEGQNSPDGVIQRRVEETAITNKKG